MRVHLHKKLCLLIAFLSVLILFYAFALLSNSRGKLETSKPIIKERRKDNLKYILLWTPSDVPFRDMNEGQQGFIDRHCTHQNCFVTANREYLSDYTQFEAIVFAGPEVVKMYDSEFPTKRSPHQKFVFASFKPAETYYPVCSKLMDGFFNWTWTYKLDSDIRSSYIVVRDVEGNIIGPNKEMHWIKSKDMKPVNENIKDIFKHKSEIVLRILSNCETRSRSEYFAKEFEHEIQKLNQNMHAMFYNCKDYQCSYDNIPCEEIIKKNYLFFLSFEISFDEDYVTDRLLFALQNRAIPIVFGGANYTRFIPDGAYMNARDFRPEELAKKIMELITDIDKYAEYFKWTNHYRYEKGGATIETNEYCRFCSLINDEDTFKESHVYEKFREWWNPPNVCG